MSAIPVIRYSPSSAYLNEPKTICAQRNDNSKLAAKYADLTITDTILVGTAGANHSGNFTIYFAPEEVVRLANTMLTDEERAFINVPVATGAR